MANSESKFFDLIALTACVLIILVTIAFTAGQGGTTVFGLAVGDGDTTADFVLGQPDFASGTANNGGVSAKSLEGVGGIALDTIGRVYVADKGNNRVLVFNNLADTTADLVLGQPTFTANAVNNGGISANSMRTPYEIAVDSTGRVYVSDRDNNRVLIFTNLSDTTADTVLGQPSFSSSVANNGGVSANSLSSPSGIAVDSSGRIFVADWGNYRVLVFSNLADTTADLVLGQPNFTSGSGFASATATRFNGPEGIYCDSIGRVFVADANNNRILIFTNLADTTADVVLGQPDFTSNTLNNGGVSANSLYGPFCMASDSTGRMFVTDFGNYRVLAFNNLADTTADLVLGQPNFTANTYNNGGISANSLGNPWGVAVDTTGRVIVADASNYRVLFFNNPPAAMPVVTTTTTTTVYPSAGGPGPAINGGVCIITRLGLPPRITTALRSLRDMAMNWPTGRILTMLYYAVGSSAYP